MRLNTPYVAIHRFLFKIGSMTPPKIKCRVRGCKVPLNASLGFLLKT